jgi:hypothetical protein
VLVLVMVVMWASPVWAAWQSPGSNQVGVKALDVPYQATDGSILVTVSGVIHKVSEEEFHIAVSSDGVTFIPIAVKHMKPFATDNIDTVVALVPHRSWYRVSTVATGAVVVAWYEQGDGQMPTELAVALAWILAFVGGVMAGRL